jgi:hypothetical protein
MERFYSLMASKRWPDILRLAKEEQSHLKNSPVEWQRICGFLENEFIRYATAEKPVLVAELCRQYIALIISNYISLSDDGLKTIEDMGIEANLKISEREAIAFARICRFSTKASQLMEATKKPNKTASNKEVNQPQTTRFKREDWLSSLFKSQLEFQFYQALKDVLPTYFVYPNVVISNIFDFDMIQEYLTDNEKDFFFKGVVDFVVYDPADNHKPKYFFEVDSSYHDNPDAIRRDNLKDSIFDKANIPLHRMRAEQKSLTTAHDFKVKIIGIIRTDCY